MGPLNNLYNWVKDEPITAGLISAGIFTVMSCILWKLPRRIIRRIWSKRATTNSFPFKQRSSEEFGNELKDKLWLTCYENPFVPKEIEIISESDDPESARRRIYIGPAEVGKTRTAYEWIMSELKDKPNSEILIPEARGFPNLIKDEKIPTLKGTVVLFYDDLHTSMLSQERSEQEGDGRTLAPEDRFKSLVETIKKRCDNLYIVCTARWESEDSVRSIKNYSGVWKTFDILTLKDAPKKSEAEMICKLAKHLDVKVADNMIEQMAELNRGRSYENTVVFMRESNKHAVEERDLEDYAKSAAKRWEDEVFCKLLSQNRLVEQLVGAMYTLRFEAGLPLYQRFIVEAAAIKTAGLIKIRRLERALLILYRNNEFRLEGNIVLCHDFQLEISAKINPDVQECLDKLFRCRHSLSEPERDALAEYYFHNGVELYYQNNFESAAVEWEKSISVKPDEPDVYNNWGAALYNLAKFRDDEDMFLESMKKYERALELKPDYPEAYCNWGAALYDFARLRDDENMFRESMKKCERALELKPDYPGAYYNWGNALYNLAKLRDDEDMFFESMEKYERAVELNPDFPEAYDNWGVALSALAKLRNDEDMFQQAIQKFKKSLEIDPDYLGAHFNSACWYALRGLAVEACDSLEKAFSLYPGVIDDISTDSDFDPIRDDPVFQQWLREHSRSNASDTS